MITYISAISARGLCDTAYIYPCLPCTRCLGKLDQNGIKTIVTPPVDLDSSWRFDIVLEMAKEMGITIIEVEV
jgi:deoxycytidylate deaminase